METTSQTGTLTRSTKQSDASHPHYFNSFQNYCCGPKAKASSASSPSNKDQASIPENTKTKANEILRFINSTLIERLSDIRQFTSILPFEFFEQDHGTDCQRYLVDRTMFKTMNEARVINWMPSFKELYPVRTSGNGNCLLHAVLIAMAGIHDFDLYLRDRLVQFMDKNKDVLKGIWKTERLKTDKMYGIQSEDPKLDSEWEELRDLVRYENSDDGQTASSLQFLEAVHIFSVANMLGRPIIILAEDVVRNKHGEAISLNDLFGIYLPILSGSQENIPIVLAYDQSHFCPLLTNDKKTGTPLYNYLPLCRSAEPTRNATLLPIRFVGSEKGPEQAHALLQNYLRIRNFSHCPNGSSVSLSILCAELGAKHWPDNYSFFLLYYKYVTEFFETQRRNSQENERPRDQEYSLNNHSSHVPNQQALIDLGSSSPPPPYSSIITRSNNNKTNVIYERRPSYEKAVGNGASLESSDDAYRSLNHSSESQHSQKPQNHVQVIQRGPLTNTNHRNTGKQQSYWEPIDTEQPTNGKITSNSNVNTRASESKLKQEELRSDVRMIPIHLQKRHSPTNLIDFDQKTDKIRPCIVCKHSFNDQHSTAVCPKCDSSRLPPPPPRHFVTVRSQAANIYPISQRQSDFITPLSTSSSSRVSKKVFCPSCRGLNLLPVVQNRMDYICSTCQARLHAPHY